MPEPASTSRSQVVLRVQGELLPNERAGLVSLLEADFRRRGLTLSVETSEVEMRRWVDARRVDARVLLVAILDVPSSKSWQLSIIDAARGRAIARPLPGGTDANAAALEAVASIISSAASALSDGLEVASQPIDDVVEPALLPRPTPVPQPEPPPAPLGVRSSLGAVVSSFAPQAPLQVGFSAALGLRLAAWGVRLTGARFLPARLDSAFGSFSIGRTAFSAGLGPTWALLMAAVAAKDAKAQRHLVERLGARVRRLTGLLCSRAADADDAAQQAMLEILRSASSFREPTNLRAWADRITVRTTLREQRRERLRKHQLLRWLSPGVPPWGNAALPAATERMGVDALLAELSPDRRHVFVLRHALEYTVEEISELTEAPEGTVKDRLVAGRKQLRLLLERDERRLKSRGSV